MISVEWYRNFLAVYRSGSVSGAARDRSLTQPAVSQQLAALEAAIGVPLFERTSRGMKPTARGEALYTQVFDALDRLERVSRSLTPRQAPRPVLRLGSSPEYFHEFALPRLAPLGLALSLSFASERELIEQVENGALDAAVTSLRQSVRTLEHRLLGEKRYVLIGASSVEGLPSEADLAAWLNSLDWVSYSEERPITRRFWQQALGSRFEARPRLVVPDLRSVVRAVELGQGVSIVPEFAARRSLDEGRIRELWPIGDHIPADQFFLTYRTMDAEDEQLLALASALA